MSYRIYKLVKIKRMLKYDWEYNRLEPFYFLN